MNFDLDKIISVLGQNAPTVVYAIFGIAGMVGILLTLNHLNSIKHQANRGQSVRAGRAVFGIFCAVSLISFSQLVSVLGETAGLSYGAVTYGIPNVASRGVYGYGADAINAALSVARVFGIIFAYGGLKQLSDSNLEGNTELSSSNMRGKAITKLVCGTLLIFNPEVIESLGYSFG